MFSGSYLGCSMFHFRMVPCGKETKKGGPKTAPSRCQSLRRYSKMMETKSSVSAITPMM